MEAAALSVKIGADIAGLTAGTNAAVRELKRVGDAVTKMAPTDLGKQGAAAARTLVQGMSAEFRGTMSKAREDLARGLITPEEFRARGAEAAKAYNQGLLSGINNLSANGGLGDNVRQQLVGNLKSAGIEGGQAMESALAAQVRGGRLASLGAEAGEMFSGNFARLMTGAAVIAFFRAAAGAADEYETANRKLAAAAKITGQNLGFLQSVSVGAQHNLKLSAANANELTIAMTKLASKAGAVDQTGDALKKFLDLAAANGMDAARALEVLNTTLRGQDEGLNALGLADPSGLYREWAKEAGTTAAKMTDTQKSLAILTALMESGAKVPGHWAKQFETAAGAQALFAQEAKVAFAELGKAIAPARIAIAGLLTQTARGARLIVQDLQIIADHIAAFFLKIPPRLNALIATNTLAIARMLKGLDPLLNRIGLGGIGDRLEAQARNVIQGARLRIEAIDIARKAQSAAVRGAAGISGDTSPINKLKEDVTDTTDKVKNLSAALERVIDQLASFRLYRDFGLLGFGEIPDAISAAIAKVVDLTDKVRTLGKDIAALGKKAPADAAAFLAHLKDQLQEADVALRSMMDNMNLLSKKPIVVQLALPPKLPTIEAAYSGPVVLLSRGAEQQVLGQLGSMFGPLDVMGDAFATLSELAGEAGRGLKAIGMGFLQFGGNLLRLFNPLTIAASLLDEAFRSMRPVVESLAAPLARIGQTVANILAPVIESLTPVFEGLADIMEQLGPTIVGLGQAFAAVLRPVVPLLAALLPIIRAVAVALTYLAQVFLNIAGGIMIAIGTMIQAIGKAVDPLVKGTPLRDLGKGISQAGEEALRAAGAMSDARDQIRASGLEDAATDAANALSSFASQLTNVPAMLQVDRLRAAATGPVAIGGKSAPSLPERPRIERFEQSNTFHVSVQAAPGDDGDALVVKIGQALKRRAGRFGSDASFVAHAWPA